MILKVKEFKIVEPYKIKILFSNDFTKTVDLQNQLYGEVFEPLKDPNFFRKAYLTEWNVIEWPNGADFAPEFLYEIGT